MVRFKKYSFLIALSLVVFLIPSLSFATTTCILGGEPWKFPYGCIDSQPYLQTYHVYYDYSPTNGIFEYALSSNAVCGCGTPDCPFGPGWDGALCDDMPECEKVGSNYYCQDGASSQTSPPGNVGSDHCERQLVGHPIDPYDGSYICADEDIGYPYPSMAFMTRRYNSFKEGTGPFGVGTATGYDHKLLSVGSVLEYITPEGGLYIFTDSGGGVYKNTNYPFLRHAEATVTPRQISFTGGPTYTFNATTELLGKIEDENGNYVDITRNASGDITDIDDSFGRGLSVISTSGIINSIAYKSDPLKKVEYEYFPDSTLQSVRRLDGNIVTFIYNSSGLTSTTNPLDVPEFTNLYNATSGRVESQEYANGGILGIDYTENYIGHVTETLVTLPEGGNTTYRYSSRGYITETEDHYGNKLVYSRESGSNLLSSITDPLNRTTGFTYDANGFIDTVTDPASNTTAFVYDAALGKPEEITDALGNTTRFEYDGNGNLSEIQPPAPYGAIYMTYNPAGLVDSVINALGTTVSFDYYPTGQIANTIDPSGNTIAHYDYNETGQLVSATAPGDRTTFYIYDDLGRIQTITDAISAQTAFTNDLDGNLTGVEDARLNSISFTYNDRGFANAVTDQLSKTETYGYDLNDNLTSFTDRKGQVFTYTYDFIDRIVNAVSPGSGNYTTYDYDAASRITDINEYENDSLTSSIGYAYTNSASGDKFEDRVKTAATDYDDITNTVTYDYDELGRRTSMTVEGEPTVYYTYDTGGFLNSVSMTDPVHGEQTFTFARDVVGRRTDISYPNGVGAAYEYYPTGAVYTIAVSNSSGALESLTYTYDESGNRKSMVRDNIEAKLPLAFTSAPVYDNANRLTSFNSATVLHDDNGNITSWGSTSYTWNAKNQLTAISGASLTASFKYDAVGRRVEKTINGVTTRYLYDGADIIMEMTSSGTPTVFYVRTLNIDEPLARIDLSTGDIRYYHADALGSIIALTDENATVKTQYNYSPFGQTEKIGEASDNPFQYTGRENDGDTGLYYYRARYYSAEMGRFISEDPIGLAGGINMYAYVGNNPVNFVDPLGLYGTTDCSYYQQACKTNGGFYECQMAERACNSFSKQSNTYNCIRQCLQEKHKERQPEGQCSEKGQTGLSDFFSEHEACFVGCFKNPENPYNPDGPDLPDKDIRLY